MEGGITSSASSELLSDRDGITTQSALCVRAAYKTGGTGRRQPEQLYKRADSEPTAVTLEDRGISLIVQLTVTA